MTKITLIELANPYPHIPITMQLSETQDTASLGLWCMLKNLHSLDAYSITVSITDNHQGSHHATLLCLIYSKKLHRNGAS